MSAQADSMPRGQIKNHLAFDIAEVTFAGLGLVVAADFVDGARHIVKQA